AVRSLGDPSEHRRTFVATESELLAGDHTGVVWRQCGSGLGHDPPVGTEADASLAGILALAERLLDSTYPFLRDRPMPRPGTLYPSGVQASMPEPAEQLAPALSVQLTRAEKDVLDLLDAWPLCTREQIAGLMGGVTLRRVNQVLRSLAQHGLVRSDEPLHMLTDEGLTYLARRDRAAVGLTLDRWSAEPLYLNADVYAGTAVRALASQMRHHAGVVDFVAGLSAEVARSQDHDLFDLLPTSRSSIGYRYDWTNYVIHPDASFTLEYQGRWRPYLLEFERRATTPKRARARLESYQRYFASGWAEQDHEGRPPRVLFVFESSASETAFLDVADTEEGVPIVTSNAETIAARGILGNSWTLPPPHSLDRRPLSLLHRVQQ
ncbi:MAG: replication-relaxation family protein, partial [Chloroflexi bacterium]|nr:replication-relaxation family protein [Chloroflexota bacterium]